MYMVSPFKESWKNGEYLKSLDTRKMYWWTKAVTKAKLRSFRNRVKTEFGVKTPGSKEKRKGFSVVIQIQTWVICVFHTYSSWSKKPSERTEKRLGFRGIIHQYSDSINVCKTKDDFKVAGLRLRDNVLQWISIYTKECITRATHWPSTGLHNSTAIN